MNAYTLAITVRHIVEMLTSPRFYADFQNWPTFLADYLGINYRNVLQVHLKDGTKITVRAQSEDKWPIHEVFIRDDYKLYTLKPRLKRVVDLGGHTGDFAIQAARLNPQAHIISLEPSKENYQMLQTNIRQNKLHKRIKTLNLACAHKREVREFFLDTNSGGHSLVSKEESLCQIQVRAITLSDVLKRAKFRQCDLLKLDIEGGEYEILYQLPKKVFSKINAISMEYHNLDTARQNGTFLAKFLRRRGFQVTQKDSIGREVGQLFATKKI